MKGKRIILGAGMTGLAAGWASGLEIYEAHETSGGICSSYYMPPFSTERLFHAPAEGTAYHFELGGGALDFWRRPCYHTFYRRVHHDKNV